MDEIADRANVARSTIQRWIERHDIERQEWGTRGSRVRGWNRINVDDGLTTNARSELRARQREMKQTAPPLTEERGELPRTIR